MSFEQKDGRPEPRQTEDELLLLRILDELCNASSNDARTIAVAQLREAVENLAEDAASPGSHDPAVAALDKTLQVWLKGPRKEERLAAIAVVRHLFRGEAETLDSRAQRAYNAFRALFHTDVTDMETAKAAARLAADLSNCHKQFCDQAVIYLVNRCLQHLKAPSVGLSVSDAARSAKNRAVSAMVVAELSVYVPVFVFRETGKLRAALWQALLDESRHVRENAARAMQALLDNVVERANRADSTSAVEGILREMLARMQTALMLHQIPRWTLHGILILLSSLAKGEKTRDSVRKHFTELCSCLTLLQCCADSDVRDAVAGVLPELVPLRKDVFVSQRFLQIVHKTTMQLAESKKVPGDAKGRSLESLGQIANEVGAAFTAYLPQVLDCCEAHISSRQGPACIPQKYVLSCIMYLAKCSHGSHVFENRMRRGLLKKVFQCEFRHELVLAVCAIQEAVPPLAEVVEDRVMRVIAEILRRGRSIPSRCSIAVGATNKLGLMMRRLHPGNVLQAANVIDHVFQLSEQPTQSTRLFSQTASVCLLQNLHIGSHGSSFESHSFAFKDSSFQSFLRDGRILDIDASDPAEDFNMHIDKAQSPWVALKAIGHYNIFNMKAGDISLFTKQFVLDYLDYENVMVRFLAVLSCAKLTQSAVKLWNELEQGGECVRRLRPDIRVIISKIVALAVADPSPDVRTIALSVLQDNQDFHAYLVEPAVLKRLFLCFYDEHIGVRVRALTLAGRLVARDPAHIAIPLRKFLAHILKLLRTKGDYLSGMRKECTHLLQVYIQEAPSVVAYFSEPVLDALVSTLKCAHLTNDRSAARPVLIAIGALGGLSKVWSSVNLELHCDQIAPVLVSYILDDTCGDSGFCKIAIHALLKVVQCSGYVIEPYETFPRLLPGLLQLLRNEVDSTVRLEIEALLGCIGAVDPLKHKDASLPSLTGRTHVRRGAENEEAVKFRRVRRGPTHATSFPGSGAALGTSQNTSLPALQACVAINPGFSATVSADLFAVGAEKLKRMLGGYVPVWLKDGHEEVSLVGRLEHPFTASKEYFPSIALDKLVGVACSANERQQHREVFGAIIEIVTVHRDTCFLDVVFPCFLWVLRPEECAGAKAGSFSGFQEFVMARVTELVALGQDSINPYVFDTVLLFMRYMKDTRFAPRCVVAVCKLLGNVKAAIGDASFAPIFDTVLGLLLEALSEEHRCNVVVTESVLRVIESCGSMLADCTAIVLGTVVNVVETSDDVHVQESALRTLVTLLSGVSVEESISVVLHPLMRLLAGNGGSTEKGEHDGPYGGILLFKYLSALFHPLVRLLGSSGESTEEGEDGSGYDELLVFQSLSDGAARALATLAYRAPESFDAFVPVVAKALKANPIASKEEFGKRELRIVLLRSNAGVVASIFGFSPAQVRHIVSSHVPGMWGAMGANDRGDACSQVDRRCGSAAGANQAGPQSHADPNPVARVGEEDQDELLKMFAVRDDFTANDWERWRANLEVGLIRHSSSAALRACLCMFDSNANVARSLFNAAFLSCWSEPQGAARLSVDAQVTITNILVDALESETVPLNVTQLILNLLEFMEHDERPLPAPVGVLVDSALRCGAFAKALRYKEGEYAASAKSSGCAKMAYDSLVAEGGLLAIYDKVGAKASAEGAIQSYEKMFGSAFNEHCDANLGEGNVTLQGLACAERLSVWDDVSGSAESRSMFSGRVCVDEYAPFEMLREEPVSSPRWSLLLKKVRDLNDLGELRASNDLVKRAWEGCDGNTVGRQKLAVDGKGVSVAFDLSNWGAFEERIGYLSEEPFLDAFYRTLLLVGRGRESPNLLNEAETQLREARRQLDIRLTARLNEGYPRAYLDVVHAQTLVELDEMITYLRVPEHLKGLHRARVTRTWKDRLDGCKYDPYMLYRSLMIRSLVLSPQDSKDLWIECSAACRKSNRMALASEALGMLVVPNVPQCSSAERNNLRVEDMSVDAVKGIPDLETRYAVCKHLWAGSKVVEAFDVLKDSAEEYARSVAEWDEREGVFRYVPSLEPESQSNGIGVAAEAVLTVAKWSSRLARRGISYPGASNEMAIFYAAEAARMRPGSYKPWHWWAKFNHDFAKQIMERAGVAEPGPSSGDGQKRLVLTREAGVYVSNAVKGYFKAIRAGGKTSLEDALKVLTMWFKYGSVAEMHVVFDGGFEQSLVTGWLDVIPQIIARLHCSNANVQAGIERLLVRIGIEHPQMVVHSLIAAKTSQGPHGARQTAVTRILESVRRKHANIVSQAEMVAHELVRMAVLWGERWYKALDEASRLYFGRRDIDGMIGAVSPLHKELARGPQTAYERAFVDLYGDELEKAHWYLLRIGSGRKWGQGYERLRDMCSELWDLYSLVYKRLRRHQDLMVALDLGKVSQHLRQCSDLELAVPGSYDPCAKEVVSIHSFGTQLRIFQSNQRPRKLCIVGSDGRQYDFLLKGNEDLRQDERVMQVFGLINRILRRSEIRSLRRGVEMHRYAVVPLSCDAGLIEWVPNCDTMLSLVENYRAARKIGLCCEVEMMHRVAPDFDRLPLSRRVSIFQFMLSNTSGADIARVLWLRSRNSEVWLDRRTTYALSLAATSMVGYLLGLGDRHPGNVMMDRVSGKIVHIDFGDCFEVAQAHAVHPEKVPFRLTRMLVNALEPCGVEGYFRHTCEAVMRVLRNEGTVESVLCMMEAFVYDPVVRMKLVGGAVLQRLKGDKGDKGRGAPSALDEILNKAAPPLVSESLRKEVSARYLALMQAQSLEGARLQELLLQHENRVPEEPVAWEMQVPGGVAAVQQQALLHAPSPSIRSRRDRDRLLGAVPQQLWAAVADERAAIALQRVKAKLLGLDFNTDEPLDIEEQVSRLIAEAQNLENLCSHFSGWCAAW